MNLKRKLKENKPLVVDLFAGAGGLSLGAARAGFEIAAAVELDSRAIQTHTKNFPTVPHLQTDISLLSGEHLLEYIGLRVGELTGLIGGPPCQGFSTIGQQRVNDPRNELFGHFMRLVSEIRPAFFLAENVPGILHEQFNNVRETALSLVPKSYMVLQPIIVRAENLGAPTRRKRVVFVGFDPSRLPQFTGDFTSSLGSSKSVRVFEGLEGLPLDISSTWRHDTSKGMRELSSQLDPKGSAFLERVTNSIPSGVGDPNTLDAYKNFKLVSGCLGTTHTPDVEERFGFLAWGQTDPVSRAKRLDPNDYCPTLRAGTGSDRGSFQAVRPVHYARPRVITPREAARLQGFPDWYLLPPTKWHSFRMVGNSVSPIVAEALMTVFGKSLNSI